MDRKFTLRKNGQMMTDFCPKISLSQEQIDWCIAEYEQLWGNHRSIAEIVQQWLDRGQEDFQNQVYGEKARRAETDV